MVMINSWLLYRRDAESLSLQRKDIRPLASFKLAVAHALVKKGKAAPVERGRPSSSEVQNSKTKRSRHISPEECIRFDQFGHFPILEEKRNRCKNNQCTGKTMFICKKCKVNLCVTPASNCFSDYHGEC